MHAREEQVWGQGRNCKLGSQVVSVSLNVMPGSCGGAAGEGFLKLVMEEAPEFMYLSVKAAIMWELEDFLVWKAGLKEI